MFTMHLGKARRGAPQCSSSQRKQTRTFHVLSRPLSLRFPRSHEYSEGRYLWRLMSILLKVCFAN